MSKMECGERCKPERYQRYEAIINKDDVLLVLKVINKERNPFTLFNSGKLEIAFRKKDENSETLTLMTIALNTATCNKEMRICQRQCEGDLVCSLKYRDRNWKTRTFITEYTMPPEKKDFPFCVPYGNGQSASFTITVEFRNETDIEYQTHPALCEDEKRFIKDRRKHIWLNNMPSDRPWGEMNEEEAVPNIAIIGSGGGIRAVIGMGSALSALQDLDILDLAMYTAGVSGSAWYLLTLYAESKRGFLRTREVNEDIRLQLDKFKGVYMAWNILKYYIERIPFFHGKYFTFTNIFGRMIGRLLLSSESMMASRWSDTRQLLELGSTPLPLVAALHVRDEKTSKQYHEWIEFSPYRVYIPKYGTAIDMQEFGSEFDRGFITKKNQEPPIHYLQGICGSAYAYVREGRPRDNRTKVYPKETENQDHRNQQSPRETALQGVTWYMSWIYFLCKLWGYIRHSTWILCRYVKDFVWQLFNWFDAYFIAKVPNFLLNTHLRRKEFLPITQIPIQFMMGDRVNSYMLYSPDLDEEIDFTNDHMMLLDAGLSFNSPYPLVLQPSRQVDIIVSFDWSDRDEDDEWPFGELEKAEKWAKLRDIPFPELRLDEIRKDWVNGNRNAVYVFEGDDAPTIVHFVMINKSVLENGTNQYFKILPEYATLRFKYSESQYDKFRKVVESNVFDNFDKIEHSIRRHIVRRQEINAMRA